MFLKFSGSFCSQLRVRIIASIICPLFNRKNSMSEPAVAAAAKADSGGINYVNGSSTLPGLGFAWIAFCRYYIAAFSLLSHAPQPEWARIHQMATACGAFSLGFSLQYGGAENFFVITNKMSTISSGRISRYIYLFMCGLWQLQAITYNRIRDTHTY